MIDPRIFESLQSKIDQEAAVRDVSHYLTRNSLLVLIYVCRSSMRLFRRSREKV